MMDLADLVTTPPAVHRHQGTCCWVQKGAEEHGDEWRGQIRTLLADLRWPDKELSVALGGRGIRAGRQSVYRHRSGACDCCRMSA